MSNMVILTGNLGANPDIHSFADGGQVANFSLATSERWRDKNTGEKRERTEWHHIAVYGALAKIVQDYCKKGSKIMVVGQLRTRKYQDQSGQDRYTTEVVLQGYRAQLELLGSASGGDGAGRDAPPPAAPLDDDIPF